MTTSVTSLALRIAQIIEENSEKDIRAAINLLENHGHGSDLLSFLAKRRDSPGNSATQSEVASHRNSLENTTSLAVMQLKEVDTEKYRLLAEFDKIVRRGQALGTFEDLRRFGESISKDFQPRKSRKDTIGHLLAILSEKPLREIEKLIEIAASLGVTGDTDEYQRLAAFLIRDKDPGNPGR